MQILPASAIESSRSRSIERERSGSNSIVHAMRRSAAAALICSSPLLLGLFLSHLLPSALASGPRCLFRKISFASAKPYREKFVF